VQPQPLAITQKVTAALERLGIPYFIGGSLASSVHGVIRATLDADLVADLHLEHIPGLVNTLKSEFYIDEEMIVDAVIHAGSFNLIHLESMFKVDVFILKQQPFDLTQMSRRMPVTIGDDSANPVYFSTAEDMILVKLAWFRAGGEVSERQWQDVLGMLSLQSGSLDRAYLQGWAETLGLADLLEKAVRSNAG
jgi:hypothetical protein